MACCKELIYEELCAQNTNASDQMKLLQDFEPSQYEGSAIRNEDKRYIQSTEEIPTHRDRTNRARNYKVNIPSGDERYSLLSNHDPRVDGTSRKLTMERRDACDIDDNEDDDRLNANHLELEPLRDDERNPKRVHEEYKMEELHIKGLKNAPKGNKEQPFSKVPDSEAHTRQELNLKAFNTTYKTDQFNSIKEFPILKKEKSTNPSTCHNQLESVFPGKPRPRSATITTIDYVSHRFDDIVDGKTQNRERRAVSLLVPPTMSEIGVYRQRTFSMSGRKGFVNHGDLYKAFPLTNSANSILSYGTESHSSDDPASESPRNADEINGPDLPLYKVLVVGAAKVGKTSLIQQFASSEYRGTYQNMSFDDAVVTRVPVELDGEDSLLEFQESTSLPLQHKEEISAYVIVYSVIDKKSFQYAVEITNRLQRSQKTRKIGSSRSCGFVRILVGNKSELMRRKSVTTEDGKSTATKYGCKYIETSAALNHHIDTLLVGILIQIKRHIKSNTVNSLDNKKAESTCYFQHRRYSRALRAFLSMVTKSSIFTSRSCDNLLEIS
ncbi:unnamed protein product [Owenia fusiformis]|uniref:Uncharacterized protein n=1 Tax=Owenia fusiformis TaxID=6347 RepID=A0A8S4PIJ4_OWEFU|nr:unnamed protein product [Owenia fusiformis]